MWKHAIPMLPRRFRQQPSSVLRIRYRGRRFFQQQVFPVTPAACRHALVDRVESDLRRFAQLFGRAATAVRRAPPCGPRLRCPRRPRRYTETVSPSITRLSSAKRTPRPPTITPRREPGSRRLASRSGNAASSDRSKASSAPSASSSAVGCAGGCPSAATTGREPGTRSGPRSAGSAPRPSPAGRWPRILPTPRPDPRRRCASGSPDCDAESRLPAPGRTDCAPTAMPPPTPRARQPRRSASISNRPKRGCTGSLAIRRPNFVTPRSSAAPSCLNSVRARWRASGRGRSNQGKRSTSGSIQQSNWRTAPAKSTRRTSGSSNGGRVRWLRSSHRRRQTPG